MFLHRRLALVRLMDARVTSSRAATSWSRSFPTPLGIAQGRAHQPSGVHACRGKGTEQRELPDQLPQLLDLQCAWLLLALCVAPCACHVLRTVPPAMVTPHLTITFGTLLDVSLADFRQGNKKCASHGRSPSRLGASDGCPPKERCQLLAGQGDVQPVFR